MGLSSAQIGELIELANGLEKAMISEMTNNQYHEYMALSRDVRFEIIMDTVAAYIVETN